MWQRDPIPWRLALSKIKSKARILGVLGITLFLLILAMVFIREIFERNIRETIRDEIARMKSRTGIVIGIRNIDVGFKSVELSQVTIGQLPWLEVDRIVVSISLNPFADFLRPDTINIGIANLKLPRDKARWPGDVKKIAERLLKSGPSNNRSKTSIAPLFLPKRLTINLQQIFWADLQTPVVDLRDVGISVNFIDKRVAMRVSPLPIERKAEA